MQTIKYLLIFSIVILIIFWNSKYETFSTLSPADYPYKLAKNIKDLAENKLINRQDNKPRYTMYPTGGPLSHEMHIGDYYQNEAIPTISSSNFKVSPNCCPSAHSTSSGCICYKSV